MSKPVKEMIRKELTRRLEGVTSLAVIGFTGLDAITTNQIRHRLREKDIRVTVVKNSVARQAFREVGLDKAPEALDGPCAVAYGSDSVVTIVRELLAIHKESPALTVKAAVLEGEVFPEDRIEELSKYPNREEAIGRVVRCILSGGANLSAALIGPGGRLASILKTIEEKQGGGEAPEAAPEGGEAPAPEAASETPEAAAPEAAATEAAPE